MNRREYRIEAIKFLYMLEEGSEYNKADINEEIYQDISNLLEHTDEIEELINKSMTSWNVSRLNLVDKAILKYAVYEMKYKATPVAIAIDEALEITKIYSDIDGKQVKFNNSVLDKVKEFI